MKQILLLLLLPCFAMAQYTGNANQKITLGEQTTADGLVYRGVENDTANITPLSDTSAYIILDTVNNKFYNYNRTTNVWSLAGGGGGSTLDTATMLLPYYRAGRNTIIQANDVPTLNQNTTGSAATLTTGRTVQTNLATTSAATFNGSANITPGVTGVLPVANGGTNTSTAFTAGSVVFAGAGGTYAQDNPDLFYNNSTKRLGIGNNTPNAFLHISAPIATGTNLFEMTDESAPDGFFRVQDFTAEFASFTPGIHAKGIGVGNNRAGLLLIGEPGTDVVGTTTIGIQARNGLNPVTNAGVIQITNFANVLFKITASGNVGIGQITPTAVLHLKAGTAAVNTAPLKFTSGVNLSTPEAGAMEFNGTNLFFSPSTTRHTVNHGLTASATLDFPSTLTLLSADLTITVTGAALSDVVSLGIPNAAVNANTSYSAWVSAANTVTVRFNNYSSGTVNPASGSFKVFVTK